MSRSDALQAFLDATRAAFDKRATDASARALISGLFERLQTVMPAGDTSPQRLPVCDGVLGPALQNAATDPDLKTLVSRFEQIEPSLHWRVRTSNDGSASENFTVGHANSMIVGPNGLENRSDIWLGATLMAPHVRYPDHDHPPEETYLVLSDSEFRQADGDWFAPGIGGSFYNTPGIRHAMRSGTKPLFALWALRIES